MTKRKELNSPALTQGELEGVVTSNFFAFNFSLLPLS